MGKVKKIFGIIVLMIVIIFAICVSPQIIANQNQKDDLQTLRSDYIAAKNYVEFELKVQLLLRCDVRTFTEYQGEIIDDIAEKYSNYVEERYKYYKEIIQNSDYLSGYRYDSEDFINDINSYSPY